MVEKSPSTQQLVHVDQLGTSDYTGAKSPPALPNNQEELPAEGTKVHVGLQDADVGAGGGDDSSHGDDAVVLSKGAEASEMRGFDVCLSTLAICIASMIALLLTTSFHDNWVNSTIVFPVSTFALTDMLPATSMISWLAGEMSTALGAQNVAQLNPPATPAAQATAHTAPALPRPVQQPTAVTSPHGDGKELGAPEPAASGIEVAVVDQVIKSNGASALPKIAQERSQDSRDQTSLRAAESEIVHTRKTESTRGATESDDRHHRAKQHIAEAIAQQVLHKNKPFNGPVTPTVDAHEYARRNWARELARQALRDEGAEIAQLDDQRDAAAFAEYLRRGNTGKLVLKVLIPMLEGIKELQIDAHVDVRLKGELPDTRWNGTFMVSNGGALTLHQLLFEDHFAQRQGSVASNNGTMTIVSCSFLSSVSMGVGGVLVNRESGVMLIRESRFESNRAMFGGAVFNFNGDLFIENTTFRGNHAQTAGGAVALGPHAQLSIVSCDFIQNSAGTDGDTDTQLGAAVIWSSHPAANCASGTSACWDNGLNLAVWLAKHHLKGV